MINPQGKIMKAILCVMVSISIVANVLAAELNSVPVNQPVLGSTSSDRDQEILIGKLLTVSGMGKSLQRFPEQIISGFKQSTASNGITPEAQSEMLKIFTDAYPQDGFVNRVRDAMKKNYDEKRYARLLKLLSTPLSKHMTELESVEPSPVDLQNYLSQVAAQLLSADRILLIQKMDSITHDSEMLTKITISSIESNAMAIVDDCSDDAAKIKKIVREKQPEIEKATRSTTQVILAFTYRDVSDVDLSEYLKANEDKDNAWMQGFVRAAIEEQFSLGIEKETKGMRQFVQSHKPKKTMFAPKCSEQKPAKNEITAKQSSHKAQYQKPGTDIRECLRFEDSARVIACTEKFNATKM